MRARTFTRLCGKENLAWSKLRTVSLSQLRSDPGTGIATTPWRHERQGSAAWPFLRDVERVKPEFKKLRGSRRTRRVAGGCRKRPRCADDAVRPFSLFERIAMSGSEFERENIVAEPCRRPRLRNRPIPASTTGGPPPRASTTSARRRIPAASASLPTSRQEVRIRSSPTRSAFSANLRTSRRGRRRPARRDGAGILVQIPHAFFVRKAAEIGFELPEPGHYAIGALFMPEGDGVAEVIQHHSEQIKEEGLLLLGWRDVPSDNASLGVTVKPTEPYHMQVFIGRNGTAKTEEECQAPALHPAQVDLAGDLSAPANRGMAAIIRSRCRAAP